MVQVRKKIYKFLHSQSLGSDTLRVKVFDNEGESALMVDTSGLKEHRELTVTKVMLDEWRGMLEQAEA